MIRDRFPQGPDPPSGLEDVAPGAQFNRYQQLRTREAVELFPKVFPLPLIARICYFVQALYEGGSIVKSVLFLVPAALVAGAVLILQSGTTHLAKAYQANSLLYGTRMFSGLYIVITVSGTHQSMIMEPGTAQHRQFLLSTCGPLIAMSVVFYVPDKTWYFCMCPLFVACWDAFHKSAGTADGANLANGFLAIIAASVMRSLLEHNSWQKFQATDELRKERSALKLAQTSLRSVLDAQHLMLCSFFDASFLCDVDGRLTHASAQMRHLMLSENLIGKRFSWFGATKLEQNRLSEFLQRAARSTGHHAMSIQTTLVLPDIGSADIDQGSRWVEAKLICTLLPGCAGGDVLEASSLHQKPWRQKALFIGLQELNRGEPPADIHDEPPVDPFDVEDESDWRTTQSNSDWRTTQNNTDAADACSLSSSSRWASHGATRPDWRDRVSMVSDVGTTISGSIRSIVPRPRPMQPPPTALIAHQVNSNNIEQHLNILRNWSPDTYDEVVADLENTYYECIAARYELEDYVEEVRMDEVKKQIVELLMIGLRLHSTWPGLAAAWRQVIFMTTGAIPVALLSLRSSSPDSVAWRLPHFFASGPVFMPALWNELPPSGIYRNIYNEIIARVNRADRRWQALERFSI